MVSSAAPEKSTGSLIAIYILVPIAFLVFVLACCLITIYKKSGAASSGSK
jgi:flagellar basal body-associated protein FliL